MPITLSNTTGTGNIILANNANNGQFSMFVVSAPTTTTTTSTTTTTTTAGSDLYSFTTFTFTNAGATGRQGPTYNQLTASYAPTASWVTSSQYFTASIQGIQEWTVPQTATYRIQAAGAAGGNSPTLNFTGGFGASVTTDVSLSQGQKVLIVVGQRGGNRFTGSGASTFNGGSGGGGTFMYDSSSLTYYVAVGGGGGAAGAAANLFTNQATASGKFNTTSGSTVSMNGSTMFALGGVGGNGGGTSNRTPTPILFGPPGAGILNSGSFANRGNGLSRTGNWLGGTTGSTSNINAVEGGFGGGGGAMDGDASADANTIAFAGGGGGYSGGAGGGNSGQSNSQYGGGGGTYYTGSFVTGSNNINQGHGYIIVTKL